MTNQEIIEGNIDLFSSLVNEMQTYLNDAKLRADNENYMEAQRLKWIADGIGLAAIKLGEQIGLDAKKSLRNVRKS